jgi:hypothetical protein
MTLKSRRAIHRAASDDSWRGSTIFRRRTSGHARWMEAGLDLD